MLFDARHTDRYEENEGMWAKIKGEILGESDSDEDSDDDDDDDDDSEDDEAATASGQPQQSQMTQQVTLALPALLCSASVLKGVTLSCLDMHTCTLLLL